MKLRKFLKPPVCDLKICTSTVVCRTVDEMYIPTDCTVDMLCCCIIKTHILLGHKLIVLNMSQQSDSTDLLGG